MFHVCNFLHKPICFTHYVSLLHLITLVPLSGHISHQPCPAGVRSTPLCFTHVVAQEHKYLSLFHGTFKGKEILQFDVFVT